MCLRVVSIAYNSLFLYDLSITTINLYTCMSPDSKVLLCTCNFCPIFRRLPDHLPRTPPQCQMQVRWCPVVLFVIRRVKSVANGTQMYYVFSGWHRLNPDASGYHPDEKGARPSIQNCDLRPGRPRCPTHQAHQTQTLIFADAINR